MKRQWIDAIIIELIEQACAACGARQNLRKAHNEQP